MGSTAASTKSCSRRASILGRFKIGQDTPTRPINLIIRRRISGGGDAKSGHQKQFRRHLTDHFLIRLRHFLSVVAS